MNYRSSRRLRAIFQQKNYKLYCLRIVLCSAALTLHGVAMLVDNWKVLLHTRPLNVTILNDVINREGVLSLYKRIERGFTYQFGLFRKCVRPGKPHSRLKCSPNVVLHLIHKRGQGNYATSLHDRESRSSEYLTGLKDTENEVRTYLGVQQCMIDEVCSNQQIYVANDRQSKHCICGYLAYASRCNMLCTIIALLTGMTLFVLIVDLAVSLACHHLVESAVEPQSTTSLRRETRDGIELERHGSVILPVLERRRGRYNLQALQRILEALRPFMLFLLLGASSLSFILLCVQTLNRTTEITHFLSLIIQIRQMRNYPAIDIRMLERVRNDLIESIKCTFGKSFILEGIYLALSAICFSSWILCNNVNAYDGVGDYVAFCKTDPMPFAACNSQNMWTDSERTEEHPQSQVKPNQQRDESDVSVQQAKEMIKYPTDPSRGSNRLTSSTAEANSGRDVHHHRRRTQSDTVEATARKLTDMGSLGKSSVHYGGYFANKLPRGMNTYV